MENNGVKCAAADGVTQTFDFCHGMPLMVRAVDFNALQSEFQKLREASRDFYNATVGQPSLRLTSTDKDVSDRAKDTGERLRAILVAYGHNTEAQRAAAGGPTGAQS